jgi:RNA ligase
MNLFDYIGARVLSKAIADGYVERKDSPCCNFYLLDYTRSATFDQVWNDATIKCRGLVVDANDDTIVGMCIPKFHNLTEGAAHHLKAYKECIDKKMSFTVTEKMDGSFGNVWWDKYQQKWRCSTRGSFESDQAKWANEWLDKNRDKLFIYFPEDDGKMSTHQNLIVDIDRGQENIKDRIIHIDLQSNGRLCGVINLLRIGR